MNTFENNLGKVNPIFEIMCQQNNMMSGPMTEQEIQKHKNKLNQLISKLINTHNIEEEISINNEIKKENECLSSLLNIKKYELNQNNNSNMNNNFNLIPQPRMKQQMMFTQATQVEQTQEKKSIFSAICVIFRADTYIGTTAPPVMIQCMPDEKVSEIIEKYRNKSGDHDPYKKFIFNAKPLNPSLSVADAGITNNSNIFVIITKLVKG